MESENFLELSKRGDIASLSNLVSAGFNRNILYMCDEEGRNALHLAVLNGHWRAAALILREIKVSPHKLTEKGESIYHSIARGIKVKSPSERDYEHIQRLNRENWLKERQKKEARLEELKQQNPQLQVPSDLVLGSVSENESSIFGDPKLFLPKYIMFKYHVVLRTQSKEGKDPAQLAEELELYDLAEFYREQMTPHMVKQRIIKSLNENLFREIAKCL